MASYLLLVYTRPISGQESEYHHWYDHKHLAEVLALPGFADAQRLAVCASVLTPVEHPGQYVATFTIESEDIDTTIDEFDKARVAMAVPPSLDPDSVSFQLLRCL
jgi:hypothetical protein